jgi:hypothetical protein
MKRYGWFLGLILMVFAGCNKDDTKDVTQLSFSFANLTSLLGKSGAYIKKASPGSFYRYTEYTDYSLYTYIFDEITVLDTSIINYHMVGDKCDDVLMFTQSTELAKAQELMLIASEEYGEANGYVLDYISDSTVYEITFSTYSELWNYISDHTYTVDDIYQTYSLYSFDNNTTYAGGFWQGGEFWPFLEIQGPGNKSTVAEPHFRSWDGKLTRLDFNL